MPHPTTITPLASTATIHAAAKVARTSIFAPAAPATHVYGELTKESIAEHFSKSTAPVMLPLSQIARMMAESLISNAPIPELLQRYGPLMAVFAGGAAVGSAVYNYIQKHRASRDRIKYAIFVCARILNRHIGDSWEEVSQNDPQLFFDIIDTEIRRMMNEDFMTQAEGNEAATRLKRGFIELSEDINEQIQKRSRTVPETPPVSTGGRGRMHSRSPAQVKLSRAVARARARDRARATDAIATPNRHTASVSPQSLESALPQNLEENEGHSGSDPSMRDASSSANRSRTSPMSGYNNEVMSPSLARVGRTFSVPEMLSSSPEIIQDPFPIGSPPSQGYGTHLIEYSSSPSPSQGYGTHLIEYSSSPSPSPQGSTNAVPEPQTSASNATYEREATPMFKLPAEKQSVADAVAMSLAQPRPKMFPLPLNIQSQSRENSVQNLANVSGGLVGEENQSVGTYEVEGNASLQLPLPRSNARLLAPPRVLGEEGTELCSVQEGYVAPESPRSGTVEYRVAESRKLYNEIKEARKFRRSFRSATQNSNSGTPIRSATPPRPTPSPLTPVLMEIEESSPPQTTPTKAPTRRREASNKVSKASSTPASRRSTREGRYVKKYPK